MRLAGAVPHITVSPPLLEELAATATAVGAKDDFLGGSGGDGGGGEVGFGAESWEAVEAVVGDQTRWLAALGRSEAECLRKLDDAIGIFVEMQEKLEEMVRRGEAETGAGSA